MQQTFEYTNRVDVLWFMLPVFIAVIAGTWACGISISIWFYCELNKVKAKLDAFLELRSRKE